MPDAVAESLAGACQTAARMTAAAGGRTEAAEDEGTPTNYGTPNGYKDGAIFVDFGSMREPA
jgi:hypothetical protein